MKNYLVTLSLVILSIASCSSENIEHKQPTLSNGAYSVIFNENPSLNENEVYSKGFKIGKVLSQKLEKNNLVTVNILIDENYQELMKTNTIFYISEGKLLYDTIEDEGEPIATGSKIRGFNNKTSMFLYKAKKIGKEMYNSSINKAKEIYEKVK